jgi:hypothetical protein
LPLHLILKRPDLDDEDSPRKLLDELLVDGKVVDTFGGPPELSSWSLLLPVKHRYRGGKSKRDG